ncbi:hypothetical protein ACH4F6_24100 [Streptomyces sp. NPDC017936]|uniref:hypothetical protein n=1 Tax=Streptomyces sp. NPDC017936 TaxID=3365016 RepID=UPI003798BB35
MPKHATRALHRTRLRRPARPFAAALACAAALALTGCQDGEGLRDEGPATGAGAHGSPAPGADPYGVAEAPARSHAEPPSGNS